MDNILNQIEIKNNFYVAANKFLISFINSNNLYSKESRLDLNIKLSCQPVINDVFNINVNIECHLNWLASELNDKLNGTVSPPKSKKQTKLNTTQTTKDFISTAKSNNGKTTNTKKTKSTANTISSFKRKVPKTSQTNLNIEDSEDDFTQFKKQRFI